MSDPISDPRQPPFGFAAHLKSSALWRRGSALFLRLYTRLHARLPAWAWGLAFLTLLGLSSLIAGGDQTARSGLSASESPNLLALGISILFKLGLVILLILASMSFLRRWRVSFPARPDRQISILETARLSPRQAIHLVRVKGQLLLIGATDQGLSLLTEFDGPVGEELLAPASPASFERRPGIETSEVSSGCDSFLSGDLSRYPPDFGSLLAPIQQAQEAP